jgi:transposase InsO family protein
LGRRAPAGDTEVTIMICPPDYVLIDHARIDTWVVISEDPTKVLVERWLTMAIDVYSRTILSAKLTYESP